MDDDKWREKDVHRQDSYHQQWALRLRNLINPFWWMRTLWRLMRAVILALVPQFEGPSHETVAGRRSSPTAFLDGLRGVASFIVLVHHFSKDPFPWLPWGWGSSRNEVAQRHVLQLPIVRIIHAGPPMVAVFFVISGFALSYAPLKQVRRRDSASLASTLASSTFRRGMRLYLPCVVTTLFMVVAMQLGYAPFPSHRIPESNIFAELWRWGYSMWLLLNPFDLSFTLPRYDDNLWTIPAELRGSMVLFMVILGVARLRFRFRLGVECAVTLWLYSYGLWDVGLFTAGLVLAELHLERENATSDPLPTPPTMKQKSFERGRWFVPILLVLGLHMASTPLLGYTVSWGYSWLASLAPSPWTHRGVGDRWIPTLGAPLLVYCADRSPRLRRVMSSPVAAYLGRISFGLYLIHGPVRYTAYHPLLETVMKGWGLKVVPVSEEVELKGGWLKAITWIPSVADHMSHRAKDKAEKAKIQQEELEAVDWRFLAAVALTWAILAPITLGIADWFSRTVDRGSVRIAKRIEAKWSQYPTDTNGEEEERMKRRSPSEERRREADEDWERRHSEPASQGV